MEDAREEQAPPPSRAAVLDALRKLRVTLTNVFDIFEIRDGLEVPDAILAGAVAFLETDPAEALAEDYAVRLDLVAATWDQSSLSRELTERDRWHMSGRAEGLREAARMLRDLENR